MVSSHLTNTAIEGSDPARIAALDPSIELAWRERFKNRAKQKAEAIRLELPSGLDVEAIRMPLRFLLRKGLIPDPVTPVIADYIATLDADNPDEMVEKQVDAFNETPMAAFKRWMTIIDTVWLCCVTRPSFTDDESREDAEEPPYYMGDVDYFDKLYVYQWAQGVDESVVEFLHGQKQALGALADGDGVPLSSEPVLRIERRGGRMVGVLDRPGDVPVGELHQEPDRGNDRRTRTAANKDTTHDHEAEVHARTDHGDDLRPAPKPRKPRSRRRDGAVAS